MIDANGSPLKRSFIDALGQEPFTDNQILDPNGMRVPLVGSFDCRNRSVSAPAKRRSISYPGTHAMPAVQTSSLIQPTFPSFMAVFGGGVAIPQEDARHCIPPFQAQPHSRIPSVTTIVQPQTQHYPHSTLQHRNSINSLTSDSTDSSPTTTASTFDSPSVTDLSPSSSPESPTSVLPLSPFKAMMRSSEGSSRQNEGENKIAIQPGLRSQSESELESNSGRNVKNLSLSMAIATQRPVTSGGMESAYPISAPISPLKEPLRTSRKKPTNLTIRTPGFDQLSFIRSSADVPSTPSQRLYLQHIQSSPALPSLMSPSLGPTGGMHLPLPAFKGHSRPGSDSSFATQSVTSSLGDLKEEDQPQKSQETQERGYLNGPVQIYDSGVYLYLEPTIEEASRFDTVINVAKEVKNPYESTHPKSNTVMSVWRNQEDRSAIPEPQTAISEVSFKSAFEWPESSTVTTPTTPRPASSSQPEYIHVPWDHNSEIINDLFLLCKIIDERVSAGKTVLVHCQLGVSRSASLVIAYGLYKGYQPTFPTMYDAVKARSRWVGPNMSLIYQLGDFRSQVERNEHITNAREVPEHWFKNKGWCSNTVITPTNAAPVPEDAQKPAMKSISTSMEQSILPKNPQPLRLNKKLPPVPLFANEPLRGNPPNVELHQRIAYEPPTSIVPPLATSSTSTVHANSGKRAAPLPLPQRERLSPPRDIPPHRVRKGPPSSLVISQPTPQMDLAMQDVPSTPSLFSPRSTEFLASPFGVTSAGDLLVGSRLMRPVGGFRVGQPSPTEIDPRSPHQRDDAGMILRHIDDIL
jgi:tyrosine-protein phosphatase MSG5